MVSKKKLKVEGEASLARDAFSKAIINNNRDDYRAFKARKRIKKDQDDKIASLENTVAEMQKLIQQLLDRGPA